MGLQKMRLDDTESGHGVVRTTGGTWKWGQGEEGSRALLPLSQDLGQITHTPWASVSPSAK